jgi:hypothetical protein
MSYIENNRSVGMSVYDWFSVGTGTFTYLLSSNAYFYTHTGAGVGLSEIQITAPADLQKAISATIAVYGLGTTTGRLTVYINGVADSNVSGKTITPTVDNVVQTFTYNFNSKVVSGDTLVFSVDTNVPVGQTYRIRECYLTYHRVNFN